MADKPEESRIDDVEDLKPIGDAGTVRLPVPSNDPNDPLVSYSCQASLVKHTDDCLELACIYKDLGLPHSLLLHVHRQRKRQQLHRRNRAITKALPHRCHGRNSPRRT